MILPVQSATAQKWEVADYGRTWVSSGPADSTGQAVATVATVPSDELWFVDRYRVSCNSTKPTQCLVCLDTFGQDIDGTQDGNYDVGDSNSPVQVPGGVQLLIYWTGASTGAVGRAYVQWTVMRQPG